MTSAVKQTSSAFSSSATMKHVLLLLMLFWNNAEFTLTETECSQLPTFHRGFVSDEYKKAEYQRGDVIYFSCDPGYTTGVNASYVCTEQGWRAATHGQCIEDTFPMLLGCAWPPPLTNGYVLNNSTYFYVDGQRARFQCDPLYKLTGALYKTCSNGQWTGHLQCVAHFCNKPLIDNGEVQGDKEHYAHNDVLTFSCHHGYEKVHDGPTVCFQVDPSAAPQWSPMPQCESGFRLRDRDICTRDVKMEGGYYMLSNHFEEGSLLTYRCRRGFYPNPLARVCKANGQWEPPPKRSACRMVECPDPAVFENGYVSPSQPQYFYQNQTTYGCHAGYTLHGPSRRICLSSGKWSGHHPVCRRDSGDHCPDPGVPPGSSRTGSLFNVGDKVTYTCNSKHILIGSEKRVCQEDGRWSGREPTCYYQHTYDTPLEVSREFGGALKHILSSVRMDSSFSEGGRSIKLIRRGILNVYIALDLSATVTQQYFQSAKNAIMKFIREMESLSVFPSYEVIFFSSRPIEITDILTFYNDKRSISVLKLLQHLVIYEIQRTVQDGVNLNAVFQTFLEKMIVIKHIQADFKEHRHLMIIVTDGRYNVGGDPAPTVQHIKSLVSMDHPQDKEEHLGIFIFGIGAHTDHHHVQRLSVGTHNRHYFRLQNYEELDEAFDKMLETVNPGLCGLYKDEENMFDVQTRRRKYPWVLLVSVMADDGRRWRCLGSLVSSRFVLTAAHCFTAGVFTNNIRVDDLIGHELDVERIHIHPLYNVSAKVDQGIKEFYDYDVALIELTKDVDISYSLRPICIPCTEETNSALLRNLTCTQQEHYLIRNHNMVNFLTKEYLAEKHAHVKLGEDRLECIHKALNAPGITTNNVSIVVTENFLCSGGVFPERDHIACKDDAGGAVFKNHLRRIIQIGLVSWGNKLMPRCYYDGLVRSDEDSRDFHINLFKVVPFLKSILGKTDQNYAPLVFVD